MDPELINKIINNPLFLKLKNVIENNPWHDNESVYDHLIKTHKIAKEKITGDFIKDIKAKKLFLDFINEDFAGVKRKDLLLITALIHDIGKLLYYREDGEEKPLRHENSKGITKMPGHEYWGSTIVSKLLENMEISDEAIVQIAKIIRLHDTFNDGYLANNLSLTDLMDDIKARAEGVYKEALFNIYCDVSTAEPSKDSIKKIEEIFNQPSFYTTREYFIK